MTSAVEVRDQRVKLTITAPMGPAENVQFDVDVAWFVGPLLRNIRSGRTGYAWLIDERGTFLYHPDATFVGRNAFEVRTIRYPGVSFVGIDQVQKERMLRGEEGTGEYV